MGVKGVGVQRCIPIGKSFGKLGKVVENSNIKISSLSKHGFNRKITREISSQTLLNTVQKPLVLLKQSGGNYLYLTEQAAVVLNPSGGLVTAYSASTFDVSILNLLKRVK